MRTAPSMQPGAEALEDSCDVCLVGGGPIGLEMAWALQREGVNYRHFEARQIGHTMTWWAPQTRWFSSNERISLCNIPLVTSDQSKATREQYLAYLRMVVQSLNLKICTHEPAVDVERHEDGTFTLITAPRGRKGDGRRRTRCNRIILAVGGTDFPRSLGIEGEDLPHVDGYFREPHRYFGQKVLVIGGKNSAVEAALRCYHAGAQVILSYRGEGLPEKSIKYWLLPEINGLIAARRITAYFGTVPTRITPTHVTLVDVHNPSQVLDVEADEVLKLIGYEQDKRLFKRAGVELAGDQQQPVFDEATMETNVPGIYVAGTAIGGTQQSYRVFLENCHVHVNRIIDHLQGRKSGIETNLAENIVLQPES